MAQWIVTTSILTPDEHVLREDQHITSDPRRLLMRVLADARKDYPNQQLQACVVRDCPRCDAEAYRIFTWFLRPKKASRPSRELVVKKLTKKSQQWVRTMG